MTEEETKAQNYDDFIFLSDLESSEMSDNSVVITHDDNSSGSESSFSSSSSSSSSSSTSSYCGDNISIIDDKSTTTTDNNNKHNIPSINVQLSNTPEPKEEGEEKKEKKEGKHHQKKHHQKKEDKREAVEVEEEEEEEDNSPPALIYGDRVKDIIAWATYTLQVYYQGETFVAEKSSLRGCVKVIKILECLTNDIFNQYVPEPRHKKDRRANAEVIFKYISSAKPEEFKAYEGLCTVDDIASGHVDPVLKLLVLIRMLFDKDYSTIKRFVGSEEITQKDIDELRSTGIIGNNNDNAQDEISSELGSLCRSVGSSLSSSFLSIKALCAQDVGSPPAAVEEKKKSKSKSKKKKRSKRSGSAASSSDDECRSGDEESDKKGRSKTRRKGGKRGGNESESEDETTEERRERRKKKRKERKADGGENTDEDDDIIITGEGKDSLPQLPDVPTKPGRGKDKEKDSQQNFQRSHSEISIRGLQPQKRGQQEQQQPTTSQEDSGSQFLSRVTKKFTTLKGKKKDSPKTEQLPSPTIEVQTPNDTAKENTFTKLMGRFSAKKLVLNRNIKIDLPPLNEDSTDTEENGEGKEKEKGEGEGGEAKPEITEERRKLILQVFGKANLINNTIKENAVQQITKTSNLSRFKAERAAKIMIENRRKACEELLEKEKTYNRSMRALQEYVFVPMMEWREDADDEASLTADEKAFMTTAVKDIIDLSDRIIADLEPRIAGWSDETTTVGDVMLKHVDSFSVYAPYFAVQERLPFYYEYMCKIVYRLDIAVKYLLMRVGLTLPNDVLIMPVQRTMRYGVTINEISKNTPKGHPDKELVDQSIKRLCEENEKLNSVVPKGKKIYPDVMKKMLALTIPPGFNRRDVMRPVRERHRIHFDMPVERLIAESRITKEKVTYRKPQCIFFGSEILLCKEKTKDGEKSYELMGLIPLSEVEMITTKDLTFVFLMKDFICNVVFDEEKKSDMNVWYQTVLEVKKEQIEAVLKESN